MNRRQFVTASALGLASSGTFAASQSNNKRCTLLHLTDTHAQLETHWEYFPECDPTLQQAGGFARLKTVIDAQRGSSQGPAFLVDGGDLVQGSGPAAWSQGEVMVGPSNALELDAFVPGNWEPVYGPRPFQRLMEQLSTKVLAYNFHFKQSGKRIFEPSAVIEREGVRIALVGIADPTTTERQPPVQVQGLDSTRMHGLRDHVQDVRRLERPDLVVAVTHTGLTVSRQLAREIPEFDVILSGHTHERTQQVIREGKVLVVEAGSNGSFLGRLDLTLKAGGGIDEHSFRLIPILASDFAEDRGVLDQVNLLLKPHRARMREVLCETRVPILRYDVFETNADNIISDALRNAGSVDIGFTNGFRFAPPIPIGEVTQADLWNLLPLDARIKKGWISGKQLKEYLERELELVFSCDPWKLSGGWGPRASGMEVRFEAQAPTGSRVRSLKVNGEAIDNDKPYTIAGCERDGEPLDVVCRLRDVHDVEYVKPSIHEALEKHLLGQKIIAPQRDGRSRAVDLPDHAFSQDDILTKLSMNEGK